MQRDYETDAEAAAIEAVRPVLNKVRIVGWADIIDVGQDAAKRLKLANLLRIRDAARAYVNVPPSTDVKAVMKAVSVALEELEVAVKEDNHE